MWEINQAQLRDAQRASQSAEEAYKVMLPEKTRTLNYLSDQAGFFTNQIYKDSRRTVMVDYCLAREALIDMGEQMHCQVSDVAQGWNHFVSYYSDLNNARKEQDSNYVLAHGIGEETEEPDDRGMFVSGIEGH